MWYNYAVASAGTIINTNTSASNPAKNTNMATESICPKGWTLPATSQIHRNRDKTSFSPILGGIYTNATQLDESTLGVWWGSEDNNGVSRYVLFYNSSILNTGNYGRRHSTYIRCVSEEKTVTDLTYMQDMTPEIGGIRK